MSEQPEALRLADELQDTPFESTRYEAAAELRRLHYMNAELVDALEVFNYAMRDANDWPDTTSDQIALVNAVNKARAAIAKATGDK